MSDDPPEQPEDGMTVVTPGEDTRETIVNIHGQDIKNATRIAYGLDPLYDRIEELGSTAEEFFLDAQQGNPRTELEYSTLLHEIHSLSISYLEGATVQLCRHHLETRSAPVEDILQEISKSIVHPETEESIEYGKQGIADDVVGEYPDEIEQQCEEILQYIENLGFGAKKKLLYKAGFSTKELANAYERVKDRRNSYIHTPEDILEVRSVTSIGWGELAAQESDNNLVGHMVWTAKEKSSLSGVYEELKHVSEFDLIEVQVHDCLILAREINAMVRKNLPYDEGLYRRARAGSSVKVSYLGVRCQSVETSE